MAYDRYTWVDGELITAEKLNHIEEGIAEGGGCDCGFECTETETALFNETVTVVEYNGMYTALLDYVASEPITELTITFDGTRYVCQGINAGARIVFGGVDPNTQSFDFTNYPFAVLLGTNESSLFTNTDGTHTIAASVSEISTETTECFKAAVNSAVSPLMVHRFGDYLDKTWREISNALMGRGAVIATQINAEGDYTVEPILSAYVVDSGDSKSYKVSFYAGDPISNYSTSSPEGYPAAGVA